jgi:nitrous oxidase accessory protein NosD
MKSTRILWAVVLAAAGALSGCVGTGTPALVKVPEGARVVEDHILWAPTNWSGEIRLVRPLIVTRDGSLTLQPGTRVYFDIPDPGAGQDPEPWILIQGRLVALGTPEQPIVFTSKALRNNELDDMIHLQEAKEAHLRNCIFERGPWALHVHRTPVEILDSEFRNNYGGVRFQGDALVLRGNRFTDNRIGVRCLNASPVVEQNEFTGNLTGVFLREGVANAVLRNNNFSNHEYDLKLGEAQVQDVDATRNWWAAERPGDKIFDGHDSEGIGSVATDPVLSAPWGSEPKR